MASFDGGVSRAAVAWRHQRPDEAMSPKRRPAGRLGQPALRASAAPEPYDPLTDNRRQKAEQATDRYAFRDSAPVVVGDDRILESLSLYLLSIHRRSLRGAEGPTVTSPARGTSVRRPASPPERRSRLCGEPRESREPR